MVGPVIAVLVLVLVSGSAPQAVAVEPGQRDPSFGRSGRVLLDFAKREAQNSDSLDDIWVTSRGKIVVAGYSASTDRDRFGLARFRADGSLDQNFGGDGRVRTGFGDDYDAATRVIGVGAGRVLAVGTALENFGAERIALARYLRDGSLDRSFGGDGRVTTDVTSGHDYMLDLRRGPGGTVTAAGRTFGAEIEDAVLAVRYLADGRLDPSYGEAGVLLMGDPAWDNVDDVLVQPDGRILAVGQVDSTERTWVVRRFTSTGELDPGFGTGGEVVTDWGPGSWPSAHSMTLMDDGRFLVVGGTHRFTDRAHYNMAVARYRPDGSLDPTFGTGGLVEVPFPRDGLEWAEAAAGFVQPSGRIVLAGHTFRYTGGETPDPLWALARLRPGGTLDTRFSDDGRRKDHIPGLPFSQAHAIAGVGTDILVVGRAFGGGHRGIIIRYDAR